MKEGKNSGNLGGVRESSEQGESDWVRDFWHREGGVLAAGTKQVIYR